MVELYVHDTLASVTRPQRLLKGFQRVSLEPGESTWVDLTVASSDLAFWHEGARGWKLEPTKSASAATPGPDCQLSSNLSIRRNRASGNHLSASATRR